MTRHIPANQQGRLQGAIGSLNSVAGIIAPPVYTHIFAAVATVAIPSWQSGATFFLAGAFVALGGLIAWISTRGEQ